MDNEERKIKMRQWQKEFRARNVEKLRKKARELNQKIRAEVIAHYSNNKNTCNQCGFCDIRALAIDHIDNNGAQHRKSIKRANIYIWLKQNGFPTGYQVLCFNCNWIKGL
jgi:hypothetical protein